MTNDELSEIDVLIAREQPLPPRLAKLLRERLSGCAAEAVALRKRASVAESRADACSARAAGWLP